MAFPLDCRPIPGVEGLAWSPFDPQVGVARGRHTTGLYTTHDGGASWHRVPYGWDPQRPDAASGFAPIAAIFLDADHWVVTGAITRGDQANLSIASRVIATRDGGQTFAPIFEGSDDTRFAAYPTEADIRPFGAPAEGVFRLDDQRLVALGRGLLFGSVDNGSTFHSVRVFGMWEDPTGPGGELSPEIKRWTVVHDDGSGVLVTPADDVSLTRDGGLTFEIVAFGAFKDGWLDPLGRVVVAGSGNNRRGGGLYEKRDGVWVQTRRWNGDLEGLQRVLGFEPDGSFIATVNDTGSSNRTAERIARYAEHGDRYEMHLLDLRAGDGVYLGDTEDMAVRPDGGISFVMAGAGAYGTRFLCDGSPGVTPRPLMRPGVPADLQPGEMAIVARRLDAAGSWDRMAFDAAGHVWVASGRALWGGSVGAALFFQGAQSAPAEWRPNAETANLPEVGGVAVGPDGSIHFALNFFIGYTARRILRLDPGTASVLGWNELRPFDDGVGGYSDGDIFDLQVVGGRVFAMTGDGSAEIGAPKEVGEGERQHGLPGLGYARASDGTWFFMRMRRPFGERGHLIERTSIYSGELPRGECSDCIGYPGVIQALVVDEDDRVFVLDRFRGEVWMRPWSGADDAWQLVAEGFHNPADLALRDDRAGRYLVVLDGDVLAFRPDPAQVAVRGVRMRAGDGEVGPAVPRSADPSVGCAAGAPCITPPTYQGRDEVAALSGTLLLEPTDEGRFCLKGNGFGEAEGSVWFDDVSAVQITHWTDTQVCARVVLDGLFDGGVAVETAAGARSPAIPFLAPAWDVRFRLRGDRPMVTGDIVGIEGTNLGARGHVVMGGVVQAVHEGRIDVQLDAAFRGQMMFRKLPGTMLWTKDITVFPTELVGAVAGPNELGGVSGHVGAGAVTWTLNDEALPGGPQGDWFNAIQTIGEHVLKATFAGRETEVTVARVPWDTHHIGPLHPDQIALPPHRQQTAVIGGLAYTLVRTSGWQRPGGPTGLLVPGIPEVVAFASGWREEGQGPFIPGQAFDRHARFGAPDEDYDRSRDMPRILADPHDPDVGLGIVRAVEYTIEPDLQGVPTVTATRDVIPLTARLLRHAPPEVGGRALQTEELRGIPIPNGAATGRMAGLGRSRELVWVALSGNDETWVVAGEAVPEAAWAPLGMVEGAWEVVPLGDALALLQTGDGDGPLALKRAQVVPADGETPATLTVGEPVAMTLDGVDVARVMAWRAEDDGGLLLALRMADEGEVVAALPADGDELQGLATLPVDWPGVGATRTAGTHGVRYGVADVVRHRGAIFVALTGAADDAHQGLWVARVEDGAMTREMASVEVDRVRCLGPHPWEKGVCGTPGSVDTNTTGCTYFACPRYERLWLPQVGGAVEQARLAVDAEGLKVTYAVQFPPGWSRDELDRGRIRTAVFRVEPFGD